MEVIGVIIAGIIIGLLGQVRGPGGSDNIPFWLTVVCGIVGVLVGYYVAQAFGVEDSLGPGRHRLDPLDHQHRGRCRRGDDRCEHDRDEHGLIYARPLRPLHERTQRAGHARGAARSSCVSVGSGRQAERRHPARVRLGELAEDPRRARPGRRRAAPARR